jgi:bacterioferritin
MDPFVSDMKKIRERAKQHIEKGAVTQGYQADAEQVCKVLNDALATELVCVLRYKAHYYAASGLNSEGVKAEFLQHANDEQGHADQLSERITQLNGTPNLDPDGLASRSHSQYETSDDLATMVKEDLIAERIAIDSYGDIIRWLSDKDPTSRRLMESILEKEEEHANDMHDLLSRFK